MFFFFWLPPIKVLPREERIRRLKILGSVLAVTAVCVGGVVALNSLLPKPAPAPVPVVVPFVPAPTPPQVVPQAQLDAERAKILTGADQMATEVERKAPGTIQAQQARSLADFIASHCGKPGGCLKK
ncbi:hypothetical protein [Burkholderia vietnamiensis]|uniref:hypothetical protein n=1 Tax=Burkholderia vietnamiensis TaxID=60552 RepID=UPI001CF4BC12|nr:hypothetical protein [Burkholderia vietnamiensis]MCA8287612.1 hypothetical protein [Burkholderia vietnamiensis]